MKRLLALLLCVFGSLAAPLRAEVELSFDFYHDQLARVSMQLGRVDESLAHADKAVSLAAKTRDVSVRLHRVELLRFAERFEPAEAECANLLNGKLPPDDERRARLALARIYSSTRHFEKAEEQLRRLLLAAPAHNQRQLVVPRVLFHTCRVASNYLDQQEARALLVAPPPIYPTEELLVFLLKRRRTLGQEVQLLRRKTTEHTREPRCVRTSSCNVALQGMQR